MTYDVPLPPCVEHQRRRRPMIGLEIELAIWRHAVFEEGAPLSSCPVCQYHAPWDAHVNYDVPLPPCAERRRQRERALLEADNRAYARAGWPQRKLNPEAERRKLVWDIWRHSVEVNFDGVCHACEDDKQWLGWFAATGPDRTPDIGTYVDEAGHRAVASGAWEPDQVKTAAEIAADTSRRMRTKERANG